MSWRATIYYRLKHAIAPILADWLDGEFADLRVRLADAEARIARVRHTTETLFWAECHVGKFEDCWCGCVNHGRRCCCPSCEQLVYGKADKLPEFLCSACRQRGCKPEIHGP